MMSKGTGAQNQVGHKYQNKTQFSPRISITLNELKQQILKHFYTPPFYFLPANRQKCKDLLVQRITIFWKLFLPANDLKSFLLVNGSVFHTVIKFLFFPALSHGFTLVCPLSQSSLPSFLSFFSWSMVLYFKTCGIPFVDIALKKMVNPRVAQIKHETMIEAIKNLKH